MREGLATSCSSGSRPLSSFRAIAILLIAVALFTATWGAHIHRSDWHRADVHQPCTACVVFQTGGEPDDGQAVAVQVAPVDPAERLVPEHAAVPADVALKGFTARGPPAAI